MPEPPRDEHEDPQSSAAAPSEQAEPLGGERHDSTGLEVARAVAAGLRGAISRRAGVPGRLNRAGRDAEIPGAHADARDPKLFGSAVDKLVTDSGWTTDVAVHGVFGRWAAIVGGEVASHCRPESYHEGRLTVRTDSTSWATQLRLLAPTVVRRLNEELGHGTVVRVDVLGPQPPSWRRGRRTVRGPGPRDTYG